MARLAWAGNVEDGNGGTRARHEAPSDAMRAKVQGTVVLALEIDAEGKPRNIRVQQGLGLGLDEKAIEAVRRWKFRAGYQNGKPVTTGALVEVNFRLL